MHARKDWRRRFVVAGCIVQLCTVALLFATALLHESRFCNVRLARWMTLLTTLLATRLALSKQPARRWQLVSLLLVNLGVTILIESTKLGEPCEYESSGAPDEVMIACCLVDAFISVRVLAGSWRFFPASAPVDRWLASVLTLGVLVWCSRFFATSLCAVAFYVTPERIVLSTSLGLSFSVTLVATATRRVWSWSSVSMLSAAFAWWPIALVLLDETRATHRSVMADLRSTLVVGLAVYCALALLLVRSCIERVRR